MWRNVKQRLCVCAAPPSTSSRPHSRTCAVNPCPAASHVAGASVPAAQAGAHRHMSSAVLRGRCLRHTQCGVPPSQVAGPLTRGQGDSESPATRTTRDGPQAVPRCSLMLAMPAVTRTWSRLRFTVRHCCYGWCCRAPCSSWGVCHRCAQATGAAVRTPAALWPSLRTINGR